MKAALLRFPRALWVALTLATLFVLPAIPGALYADDLVFAARLEHVMPAPRPGPLNLYTFADRLNPEGSLGHALWWMTPNIHLSFFRPVSSGLIALDHALFGDAAWAWHLHTLAWYLAAIAAASMVLRRLLPEREAALATIVFAIGSVHSSTAVWPSARHASIAAAVGYFALARHLDARAKSRFPVAALALTAFALLASESSLGVVAYVGAYELFGRREALREKAKAFAPYLALVVVYLAAHHALHHGVEGSGSYIDPIGQPLAFLRAAPSKFGPLVCAALLAFPSEVSVLFVKLVPITTVIGAFALTAFVLLGRRAISFLPPETAVNLRWLAIGAALAVVPGLAGITGDRLVFMASLGVAAWLSVVLLHASQRRDENTNAPILARLGVGLFAIPALVVGPLAFVGVGLTFRRNSWASIEAVERFHVPGDAHTILVGVGLSDPAFTMYLAPELALLGHAREVRLTTMAIRDHRVTRRDDRTVEIEIVNGSLIENGFDRLARPDSAPLRTGDEIACGTWKVVILADDDGRPTRFAVHFDRSADDSGLAFVTWRDGRLQTVAPPAIGETALFAHEAGPSGI